VSWRPYRDTHNERGCRADAWLVYIPRASAFEEELGTDTQAGIVNDDHDEHPAGHSGV
jgi:hypothetical protein